MKISPIGIELIKYLEGFRSEPYQCEAGKWTIGYGHTGGVDQYMPPITKEVGGYLLHEDLEPVEQAINKLVIARLNQNQYDSLCSFIFNIGTGAFERSRLLHKLNRGDYEGAADEFRSWVFVEKRVSDILVKRRERERELFLRPDVNEFLENQ
jgi:lysozyme